MYIALYSVRNKVKDWSLFSRQVALTNKSPLASLTILRYKKSRTGHVRQFSRNGGGTWLSCCTQLMDLRGISGVNVEVRFPGSWCAYWKRKVAMTHGSDPGFQVCVGGGGGEGAMRGAHITSAKREPRSHERDMGFRYSIMQLHVSEP